MRNHPVCRRTEEIVFWTLFWAGSNKSVLLSTFHRMSFQVCSKVGRRLLLPLVCILWRKLTAFVYQRDFELVHSRTQVTRKARQRCLVLLALLYHFPFMVLCGWVWFSVLLSILFSAVRLSLSEKDRLSSVACFTPTAMTISLFRC